MLKMLSAILTGLISSPALASVPLVLLPIKDIQHQRAGTGEQVVVTIEYQACKYLYKGLYLEAVAAGQGQTRYQVRALASERIDGQCPGAIEPRTDSLMIPAPATERLDLVAIQPK